MRTRLYWGALGLLIGVSWFVHCWFVDYGPPLRGDAWQYFSITQQFQSFGDALSYRGERTFGFPLFLYAVKVLTSWTGVDLRLSASIALLALHLVSSWIFYQSAEKVFGRRLHPAALALIVAQPGLVSHASVLLTDTFATDLLMLSFSLLMRGLAGAIGAGVLLSWMVLARPFMVLMVPILWVGAAVVFFRKRLMGVAACGAVLLALLGSEILRCRLQFGQVCLQNPAFAKDSARTSVEWGMQGGRLYFSSLASDPSTMVIVPDALMRVDQDPALLPAFIFKKTVALFDQHHLHAYAVDVTTPWERAYLRAHFALAYVGFALSLLLLALALRNRKPEEAFFFGIPLAVLLVQIPMHVEARYSFPAVPFCIVALFVGASMARTSRRALAAVGLVAAIALVAFTLQIRSWDSADSVQRRLDERRAAQAT